MSQCVLPVLNNARLILYVLDMRDPEMKSKLSLRSINLAISSRGITALSVVDPAIADRFMENVIPMHGRMIHDSRGKCESQSYDPNGQVGTGRMTTLSY